MSRTQPTPAELEAATATCLRIIVKHARIWGFGHVRSWLPTRGLAHDCGLALVPTDHILNRLATLGLVTWWAPGCCKQGVVWSATAKALEQAPPATEEPTPCL